MKLLNELPYHTTTISVEHTQMDIIKLMNKFEVEGYQWTTYQGKTALKFLLNSKPYLIDVPKIKAIKKFKRRHSLEYHEKIVDVREEVCFRIFYWSLKSILEVNTFGVFEKLLLPYQIIKTAEGGYKTIADTIQESPNYLLPKGDETF